MRQARAAVDSFSGADCLVTVPRLHPSNTMVSFKLVLRLSGCGFDCCVESGPANAEFGGKLGFGFSRCGTGAECGYLVG
jgi:hypothetical protein